MMCMGSRGGEDGRQSRGVEVFLAHKFIGIEVELELELELGLWVVMFASIWFV